MNNVLVAMMFGAGIAGVAYTKLGARTGYGNTQNVVTICAVAFVLASIFFYTILAYIIHAN